MKKVMPSKKDLKKFYEFMDRQEAEEEIDEELVAMPMEELIAKKEEIFNKGKENGNNKTRKKTK